MNSIKNRWQSLSDATKSSIAFFISSLVLKGISFIVTPIFTRIMDSEQYGIVATYSSWMSIIEVFALLGLTSAGIFNVGLKEHKEDRNDFIASIVILGNIITILVFTVIFSIKIFVSPDAILPNEYLILMFIHFIFSPAQTFWITMQRYEFKYKLPFLITIVSNTLAQVVSIISVVSIHTVPTSYIRLFSNVLVLLLFQIPIYLSLLIKAKKRINISIWKATLIFAIPLLPHYLSQHVMASSDKIMISNLYSSAGSAIYSVVSNISMITTIVWNAVNVSLIPYSFEKIEAGKGKEINAIVLPILFLYGVMCLGITLIAPEVLIILAPKEYYEGIFAVPPIAATAFISSLYNIYANIEFLHKKTWWISIATIVSASINIALNYILIPQMGYVGAAYTTLVSNIVLILMHYCGYRMFHKDRIYNDVIILFVTLFVLVGCLLCNILYSNIYVRYGVAVIAVMLLIIKRKFFIEKIKVIMKKQ